MLQAPNQTTILWLSDIHIWDSYRNLAGNYLSNGLPHYFEAFFASLPERIDYLLLGGDIGFAGTPEDYAYFEELFFKHLDHSRFNETKLLVVPGNHDINWLSSENLISTVKDSSLATFEERSHKYLIPRRRSEFLQTFEGYTKFFNSEKFRRFFTGAELSESYREHKLYGYCIDRSNKLIFILLNSAWVSLGAKFNDLLQKRLFAAKKKGSTLKLEVFASEVEKLLRHKDSIAEYGSQVIGSRLVEELDLLERVIYNHPDFTVMTLMHHPPNWLHWREKYNDNEEIQATQVLHNVLRLSNFLLTGHEHVPSVKSHEVLDKDTYHLKSGCFLDELNAGTNFFHLKHNRFALLQLHTGTYQNWLEEKVYRYTPYQVAGILRHKWVSQDQPRFTFYHPKYVSAAPADLGRSFNLSLHLRQQHLLHFEEPRLLKQESSYIVYTTDTKAYIVSSNTAAPGTLLTNAFLNDLIGEFPNIANTRITFHFIFKDVHCNNDLYGSLSSELDYNTVREKRAVLFDNFYTEWKIRFDLFRNHFFRNMELNKDIPISKVMNTILIFEVLPFWVFESYQDLE